MNNRILKVLICALTMIVSLCAFSYASQLDPSIPTFDSQYLSLQSDGTARWVAPTYSGEYKRFAIQLMKRISTINSGTSTVTYSYKTSGGIKYVSPDESEYTFNISSVGYYQFQIRGENLEGNYGAWAMINTSNTYEGVPVTEDDISAGGSSSSTGGGTNYNYGPGVVQYGYNPYGTQYYVIGPNGEVLYNYGANQSNYYYSNQQYGNMGIAQGPGYVNNYAGGNAALYPNTGVSSYPVAPAPNVNGAYGYNTNYNQYNNQGNANTNPNYSNNGMNGNAQMGTNVPAGSAAGPQITQGLEVGWHVDTVGRFYYQGNGAVLKGTWYFIDGSYYRFADNGYVICNQWYRDSQTGYWYYLAGDGRMLTGWQQLNGAWYYFKPENGNGYGAMYSNTSIFINDPVWGQGFYAFDANGSYIRNAWYGGYYYGNDGKRTT